MNSNGILIAIGGGLDLRGPILPEFHRLSGGMNARIVILPTASELSDSGFDVAAALARLGLCDPAQILPIHTRADAARPDFCAAVRQATGVFITGGDQARLTHALRGSPFLAAMQQMLRDGGVIAGTSAGTAALSECMILSGESGMLPQKDIAQFADGLGLVDGCIFDQHFSQRNRIGRLLYAVATHPNLLGIGVDEDTAAIIENGELRVAGSGAVTLVDGRGTQCFDPGHQQGSVLSLNGVRLNIVTHGGKFDLGMRECNGAG